MKKFFPHLISILIFFIVSSALFPSAFQGKVVSMPDQVKSKGKENEAVKFKKDTGETTLWTNALFGGMPAFYVSVDYPSNLLKHVHKIMSLYLPRPINLFFLAMLCSYILFIAMGMSSWLSTIGALGTALVSYNFIIFEVGHVNKLITICYFPLTAAGLILAFRNKFLMGGALFGLGVGLCIWSSHVQMTYYLALVLFILTVILSVNKVRKEGITSLIKPAAYLSIFLLLGVGSSLSRLWSSYEYMKYSTRGPAVLESTATNNKSGLDYGYVFEYSNGTSEFLTYLIPGVLGGSHSEPVSKNSAYAKDFRSKGASGDILKAAPLYWGKLPYQAGPVYFGAIICFLFLFGALSVRGGIKWWVLITTLLISMMSFGKNLPIVNDFFYHYLPMYSKFRAVNSITAVLSLTFPILAVLGLNQIFNSDRDKSGLQKKLLISAGITGGLCLFFALLGPSFLGLEGANDARYGSAGYNVDAIISDRVSLLRGDAFRSFIFIALTAALCFAYLKNIAGIGNKKNWILALIGIMMVVDMAGVGKRYLNGTNFVNKKRYYAQYETPRPVDEAILKDTDPNYRVLDTSIDVFNSNEASRVHKAIGGYHAVKLKRYQDIITKHIQTNNISVLNMLNTKYIIQKDQDRTLSYSQNPSALGHAWLVQNVSTVNSANAEIDALSNFDPKQTAVIHQEFSNYLGGMTTASGQGSIQLQRYAPNKLVYNFNSTSDQLAVFSEVWYASGKKGWQAYLDGQPVEHIRANYILRAMKVPAGQHEITFEFKPSYYYTAEKISLASSALLILITLGVFAFGFKDRLNAEPQKVREETVLEKTVSKAREASNTKSEGNTSKPKSKKKKSKKPKK